MDTYCASYDAFSLRLVVLPEASPGIVICKHTIIFLQDRIHVSLVSCCWPYEMLSLKLPAVDGAIYCYNRY